MSSQHAPWRDEETLRQKYCDEGKSSREVADELDCSKFTVLKWMKKFGIGTRKSNQEKPPQYWTKPDGYEEIRHCTKYGMKYVPVHRLVAIAHGLIDGSDFVNKSIDIHHKNGIPWDNRPENLEVVEHPDHAKIHYSEREINDRGQFVR